MSTPRRGASPLDRSGETWNLIYRFTQHWPLALLSGLVAAVIGYGYARQYQPVYHSETQVRVGDSLDARVVPGQKEDQSEVADLPDTLANAFRARFLVDPKLKTMVQELAEDPQLAHIASLKTEKSREDLVDHIKKHVTVEPLTRRVFVVSYDGHDPEMVQRVVQRLSEIGVADVVQERSVNAQQARSFLSTETETVRQQMLQAEIQVVSFLKDHPKMMVPAGATEHSKLGLSVADKLLVGKEPKSNVMPVQALEISSSPEVRSLLGQRAELEARVAQIESAQKFDPVQSKVSEMDRLQQQLLDLKAQNYTPAYPEYQRVTQEIERLQGEIHDNKSRRDRNLAADMRVLADAKAQVAAIDRQIVLLRARAITPKNAPADERALTAEAEYARLVRDMETSRTAYEKLHERELDAQVNEELSKVKGNLAARIEEPAKRPLNPRGVSRKMMTLLCVLLGFGLGLLLGVARAVTDPHIYTVYDLAKASKLGVLGRVPQNDGFSPGSTEVAGDLQALPVASRETNGAQARSTRDLRAEASDALPIDEEDAEAIDSSVPSMRPVTSREPPKEPPRRPAAITGKGKGKGKGQPSDYMVIYSTQRDAPAPARGGAEQSGGLATTEWERKSAQMAPPVRSRSALFASPQSAAFRLAGMGHVLHQGTIKEHPHLFLLSAPDGARAEQYRMIRCRLQDLSDPRVIVVTSALRGEGKTLAAANLALAYAEGGAHSVVMIDAHLSSPQLTELLGAQPRVEALVDADLISGGLDIWQYEPNLFLVPALGPQVRRSAVLSSPAFATLIADLKQTFDYVIIDSPAVASAADAKIVMRNADAGLFLTRARTTTDKAVRAALDRLGRGVMAGAVLNEFGK